MALENGMFAPIRGLETATFSLIFLAAVAGTSMPHLPLRLSLAQLSLLKDHAIISQEVDAL